MKKIIFLLLLYICTCYSLNSTASLLGMCDESGCEGGESCTGSLFDIFNPNKDLQDEIIYRYIPQDTICNNPVDKSLGFGNVKIGWGKNCGIPSGSSIVSDTSPISSGNLLGQIIDTFKTLLIAVPMRKQFCTFSPGYEKLEGAIVNKSLITNQCTSKGLATTDELETCLKCILQGKPYISADDCNATYSDVCTGNSVRNGMCNDIWKECSDADPGYSTCNDCLSQDLSYSPYDKQCISNSPILDFDEDTDETKYLISNKDIDNHSLCDAIPNLEKPLINTDNKQKFHNDVPVYCPLMRCNIPTNNIKTKYHDDKIIRSSIIFIYSMAAGPLMPIGASLATVSFEEGNCCHIRTLTDGEWASVGFVKAIQLRGRIEDDKICARMLFGIPGTPSAWSTLACKSRITPNVDFPPPRCPVAATNAGNGNFKSKWFFPLTSLLIQTTTEIFDTMFGYTSNVTCTNSLLSFQQNMKKLVRLLLILYVLLLGINIAIGGTIPSKKELFIFLLKFGLVIYFSVGNLYATQTTTDENKNGLMLIRNVVFSGMSSFSNIVINAASPRICNFSTETYDTGYSYLNMWDSLDCKIAFYMAMTHPTADGLNMILNGTTSASLFTGIIKIFSGLIFGGYFLLGIFLVAFGIFLISIVIYFTHLYIIAMIAINIMIFFGPIFIPLALFNVTYEYFKKWLDLLLAYAIYIVAVTGVIVTMITTFDTIVYSDCTFEKQSVLGMPFWTLTYEDPNHLSDGCKNSFGYLISRFTPGKYLTEQTGEFASFDTITKEAMNSLASILESIMLCTFFAFLFYFFADQINSFAQELSGANLGAQAIKPTAVADAALDIATGGKFSKAKAVAKQASEHSPGGGMSAPQAGGTSRSGITATKASGSASGVEVAAGKQAGKQAGKAVGTSIAGPVGGAVGGAVGAKAGGAAAGSAGKGSKGTGITVTGSAGKQRGGGGQNTPSPQGGTPPPSSRPGI